MRRNPRLGDDQVVCPCGHDYVDQAGSTLFTEGSCGACGALATAGTSHGPEACWAFYGEHDGPCQAWAEGQVFGRVERGSAASRRMQAGRSELGLEAFHAV